MPNSVLEQYILKNFPSIPKEYIYGAERKNLMKMAVTGPVETFEDGKHKSLSPIIVTKRKKRRWAKRRTQPKPKPKRKRRDYREENRACWTENKAGNAESEKKRLHLI